MVLMSFKIKRQYCWFNRGSVIVRMYFLNHIPFTFDDLPEGHLYDRELVDIADKNKRYEMEDVFVGSQYLLMEAAHPCFDNIDIENPEELPEDLEEYFNYDEEDLRG
jgi:hypothetical protein